VQRLSEVILLLEAKRPLASIMSVMQQQRTAAWWRWRSLVHNERGLCNGGRERRPPTTTNWQKSTSGEPCLSFCTSDGLTFCLKLHTYGVHTVVVQPLLQAGQMWIAYKVALAKHVVLWDKTPALNGMHSSTVRSAELGCLLTAASVSVSGSRGSCVHFVDLPSMLSIASALASKRSGLLRESAACLQCTAARRQCNLADAARSNCGFSNALWPYSIFHCSRLWHSLL
jgi:hypothetical protein